MKKKSLIGQFIRDEWNNGDFKRVWLRRIVSETKTQYVCHVQRYVRSWNNEKDRNSQLFFGKWAKRYRKAETKLGFKPIITHLSNPDGASTLSLVNDLTTLKCVCTFDELFNTDVRKFQHEGEYPRKMLEAQAERYSKRGETINEKHFLISKYMNLESGTETHPIEDWDAPIIKYLEDTFKVPVYSTYENIDEHSNLSKLTKSATYFHINHFGGDKKVITTKENYYNRTIMFWLFEDKLVFCYKDGIDTH